MEEYLIRVMATDTPPEALCHLYCFAHQSESHNGLFRKLHDLRDKISYIYILDSLPGLSGYLGPAVYRKELYAVGFCPEQIRLVPFHHTDMINTYTEAQAVRSCMKSHGVRMFSVVSPPFHLPRAYLSMISEDPEEYKIYPIPGYAGDWNETITHSQGQTKGTRVYMIGHEMDRIARYQALLCSPLCSIREALKTLNGL